MSVSRSAQLSETELSLWLVLDYGTVLPHDIVASDTLSSSVVDSKH